MAEELLAKIDLLSPSIMAFTVSPDWRKIAYAVKENAKVHVITDSEEEKPYDSIEPSSLLFSRRFNFEVQWTDRRTHQIVAFVIGDHSAETCQRLWNKIPKDYRACHTFSDFRDAYQKGFPEGTHQSVGKDTGQTNHIERWNCSLHQRLVRDVRKTLSFSKVEYMHHLVTRRFIVEYNLSITHNHVS